MIHFPAFSCQLGSQLPAHTWLDWNDKHPDVQLGRNVLKPLPPDRQLDGIGSLGLWHETQAQCYSVFLRLSLVHCSFISKTPYGHGNKVKNISPKGFFNKYQAHLIWTATKQIPILAGTCETVRPHIIVWSQSGGNRTGIQGSRMGEMACL